jgi:undecaprenyl-diphosphatase
MSSMHNLWHAIVLGIVQGLTEFLPVSSSAHLMWVPAQLRWPLPSLAFDLVLHMGTLLALLIYFRTELWTLFLTLIGQNKKQTLESKWLWPLIVATIPAVVLGLLFKDAFEAMFSDIKSVGVQLIMTATLLVIAELIAKYYKKNKPINLTNSIFIGLMQALAIIPGISRSGSTVAGGLMAGVDKKSAARFSFILAIPAIGGATLLKFKEILHMSANGDLLAIVLGFLFSFTFGLLAIHYFIKLVQKWPLWIYSIYCFVLGVWIWIGF